MLLSSASAENPYKSRLSDPWLLYQPWVFSFMQSCSGEQSRIVPADLLHVACFPVDVGVLGHGDLGMTSDAL